MGTTDVRVYLNIVGEKRRDSEHFVTPWNLADKSSDILAGGMLSYPVCTVLTSFFLAIKE